MDRKNKRKGLWAAGFFIIYITVNIAVKNPGNLVWIFLIINSQQTHKLNLLNFVVVCDKLSSIAISKIWKFLHTGEKNDTRISAKKCI